MLRQALYRVMVFASLVTGCAVQDQAPKPVVVDLLVDSTSAVGVDERSVADQLDACLPLLAARSGELRVWLMGASPADTRMVARARYDPPSTASARSQHRAARAFMVEARATLLRDVVPALRKRPPSSSPIAEALTVLAAADTPSGAERAIVVLSDFVQHSRLGHFDAAIPKHDRWFAALNRERVLLPGSLRGVSVRCAFFKPLSSLRATEDLRHLWSATLERAGATVAFTSGPAVFPVPLGDVSLLLFAVFPLTWWWKWRVEKVGFRHGWLGVPSQADRSVLLYVRAVPKAGLVFPGPESVARLRSLDAHLARFWSWPLEFLLLLVFLAVDVRSCARLFVQLGLGVADALMFGVALAILLVGVTGFLLRAFATRRRVWRCIVATLLYAVLAGALVVLRVALVAGSEDALVRWASAVLLLGCTAGPALGAELLLRRSFVFVPLLSARRRQRRAVGVERRLAEREARRAAVAETHRGLVAWLSAVYDEAYARGAAERERL